MSTQIIQAIENAVPRIIRGVSRHQPPSWIETLERQTEVWLGGIEVRHIEVAPEWSAEDNELERLVVNVITNEGVIAQGSISVEDERGEGTFDGWKIVRTGRITGLDWKEREHSGRTVPQLIATFKNLPHPVVIPAEIDRPIDVETLTEIFHSLRNPWIDSGASEAAAAQG